MAESGTQSEQSESMEEILQSIKRIMDDNTGGEQKPAEGEDVFELTDVIKEEVSATPEPVADKISEDTVKAVDSVFSGEGRAAPTRSPADNSTGGLMSEQSVSAAATAFQKIVDSTQKDYSIPSIASPALRTGNTVEDLIVEALRPMLKEWLDKNLPVIVQRIVEKEVKRIVTLHKD